MINYHLTSLNGTKLFTLTDFTSADLRNWQDGIDGAHEIIKDNHHSNFGMFWCYLLTQGQHAMFLNGQAWVVKLTSSSGRLTQVVDNQKFKVNIMDMIDSNRMIPH